MTSAKDREQQVIFAFVPQSKAADGIPTLTFMMPEASWHYMRNGLGHEFDLTNVGIPLRVIIGRSANHASGMAQLEKANGGTMKKFTEVRDADLKFGQKPKQ
jgi:hypothetical protein